MIDHHSRKSAMRALTGIFLASAAHAALLVPAAAEMPSKPPADAQAVSPRGTPLDGPEDIAKLLPGLLTSWERRKLAADLEGALRRGDMNIAVSQLNTAIDTGTLAIVLIDRLHDPNLLQSLQTLGLKAEDVSVASGPCNVSGESTETFTALRQSFEGEQEHARALQEKLLTLEEDSRAVIAQKDAERSALSAEIAILRDTLQQERMRNKATSGELAKLQNAHRALDELNARRTEAMEKVARLEKALHEEQERREAAAREIAALQNLQDDGNSSTVPLLVRLRNHGDMMPFTGAQEEPASPPAPVHTQVQVVASLTPGAELGPTATGSARATALNALAAPTKAEERLTARAEDLLRKGDVSGARLLLERAVEESGSARATFLLAETYDPAALSRRGVLGIRGDVVRARDLYARAQSLGLNEATARLEALR